MGSLLHVGYSIVLYDTQKLSICIENKIITTVC